MMRPVIGFCVWIDVHEGKFRVEMVSLRELVRRLRRLTVLYRLTAGK